MKRKRSISTSFYQWLRQLHLYFGLFICPYIVIFAVSTIMLNHRWDFQVQVDSKSVPVELEEGLEDFEQGKHILRQLGESGEIFVRRVPKQNILRIGAAKPSVNVSVEVDLATQIAKVSYRRQGMAGAMRFLHFNPGPHKGHGVNWFFSKLWGWTTDTVVYLLLFITISGIYLWTVIKAERRAGLIALGVGCLCFVGLLAGLLL